MKISTFKTQLNQVSQLDFVLPNGNYVPRHFHITEAGLTTKHFVDCGGVERIEKTISFQLWVANDTEHRLAPTKLLKIIDIAQKLFEDEDFEIELEYQTESITRFGLAFDGQSFLLTPKFTNCLASDKCGIPPEKLKVNLAELTPATADSCCTPGGGCC